MRLSFFPSKISACFNKTNILFLHVHWWLGSEEIKMRFRSDSTYENLQSSENIGKPMHYAIAESENMDSPCNDIIVFIFFHIFPSELMPIPEYKIMDMEFGSSSENIGFSTKLLSPAHSNNFHFDCVDVVVLEVGEIDNNFFETVIGPSIKYNSLIG